MTQEQNIYDDCNFKNKQNTSALWTQMLHKMGFTTTKREKPYQDKANDDPETPPFTYLNHGFAFSKIGRDGSVQNIRLEDMTQEDWDNIEAYEKWQKIIAERNSHVNNTNSEWVTGTVLLNSSFDSSPDFIRRVSEMPPGLSPEEKKRFVFGPPDNNNCTGDIVQF